MPPLEYLPVSGHRQWLHQMGNSTQLDTPVPPAHEWYVPVSDWPDDGEDVEDYAIPTFFYPSDLDQEDGNNNFIDVIPDSEDDEDELGTAEPVLPDSEDGVDQHGPVLLVSSDSEEEIDVGRPYVYVISDSKDEEGEPDVVVLVPPDSGGEADVISISSSSEYGVEDQVPPVAPHAPPDLFPPSPVFPGSQLAHREESRDADAEDEDEDVDEDEEVANISAGTLQESNSSLADLGCASSSRFFAQRHRREESDEEDWEEEASPKRPRWSDGSN
ncbi:uncharacterized protein V6R79_019789 [Siganus canaliculatus]